MHDESNHESVSTDGDTPTTLSAENTKSGFVYFIQCNGPDGPIKIGRTSDVKRRLSSLQGSCPYELVLLGQAKFDDADFVESGLHGAFEKQRIRGEWFRCDATLLELARDATAAYQLAVASWANAPHIASCPPSVPPIYPRRPKP